MRFSQTIATYAIASFPLQIHAVFCSLFNGHLALPKSLLLFIPSFVDEEVCNLVPRHK
jgi:hypothetical protein